jgi:histidinol-phosphate aminotransferase
MSQRGSQPDAGTLDLNRRSFLRVASFAGAAAAIGGFSEGQLALAQSSRPRVPVGVNAVLLNANENPLGPCEAARAAMAASIALSGRYHDEMAEEFVKLFAAQNGLKPEYVLPYPGSSQPLSYSVFAFCNADKPLVIGDPGYEAATRTADVRRAAAFMVPLRKDYSHDVKKMVSVAPNTGLYYIASPNNPTGTVTSRADIEWLLAHKAKDSIVLLDEAYIHFSDATPCLDLVAADKDIVVLRTFSKLYGMAGARLGLVAARPDLLKKISDVGGWTFCPVPALQAGIASLKDTEVVAKRKKINAEVRQETFDWLTSKGYVFVPSAANHFMIDTKRRAGSVVGAMAEKGVLIGRVWPAWPNHIRVTVGTHEEMASFRTAFQAVMESPVTASLRPYKHSRTAQFS